MARGKVKSWRLGRSSSTAPLRREIEARIPERPFAVEFWDGTQLPSTEGDGPTFYVRSPRAAAHVLRAPGQLGLGRAYVSGEIEVDDMDAVIALLDSWQPPALEGADKRAPAAGRGARRRASPSRRRGPQAELRPSGKRHSKERDARAVRHHYDVSNEFFELFLGETMVYSCAIFSRGATTLEAGAGREAGDGRPQAGAERGRPRARRRLRLGRLPALGGDQARRQRGRHHPLRRRRPKRRGSGPRQAGVADRVEIRVMDYRDLAGERFDAIASIGMVEHVGASQIDVYAQTLAGLLEPGGRLLNHGIARLRHTDAEAGAFSERYVFPDAAPLHLSRDLLALERAGFVTHHVEDFAPTTPRPCATGPSSLDENLDEAIRLAGPERVRVWRLYLRAARNGFLPASPRSTRPAAAWPKR